MRIIHIVDRFDKINFGIWNAAIFGSDYLKKQYQVKSELWHPTSTYEYPLSIETFSADFSTLSIQTLIQQQQLNIQQDIIVTHGCWQFPTRLGRQLQKIGFKWIYVPHGMLEPWSMQHKRIKKWLYFNLVEKPLSKKANVVRAVGAAEYKNLNNHFSHALSLVENGVKIPANIPAKPTTTINFLFMARLHFKKGIVPLVKAWNEVMKQQDLFHLYIAGPDEGELPLIENYLSDNLHYLGSVYGDDKVQLLSKSHYYILPSLSEGFPVSVLEAMSYGCIPIISEGCNFSTVFEKQLGYKIESNVETIAAVLKQLLTKEFDQDLSKRNADFIAAKYSESYVGEQLYTMYHQLLHTH